MPITYVLFSIGSFSLIGLPFLSGFFSKDFLIEGLIVSQGLIGFFVYFFQESLIFFTTFYSSRLMYYLFITQPHGTKVIYRHFNERNETKIYVLILLTLLAICSIFIGYLLSELFLGNNSFYFKSIIIPFTATTLNNTSNLEFILLNLNISIFCIKSLPIISICICLIFL
jgi:NADH-ubiquinone oxidoreductase chain 5